MNLESTIDTIWPKQSTTRFFYRTAKMAKWIEISEREYYLGRFMQDNGREGIRVARVEGNFNA